MGFGAVDAIASSLKTLFYLKNLLPIIYKLIIMLYTRLRGGYNYPPPGGYDYAGSDA